MENGLEKDTRGMRYFEITKLSFVYFEKRKNKFGVAHRDGDLPATYGNGRYMAHIKNDMYHRIVGPAIVANKLRPLYYKYGRWQKDGQDK